MTRTNKWTEREGKADPKYFSHTGNYGESPNHIKKQGSGKGNWGKPGDEIDDLIDNGEIPQCSRKIEEAQICNRMNKSLKTSKRNEGVFKIKKVF